MAYSTRMEQSRSCSNWHCFPNKYMCCYTQSPSDFYKPFPMQAEDEIDGGISSMLHSKQSPPLLCIMHSLPAIYLQDLSVFLFSGTLLKAFICATLCWLLCCFKGLYARRTENPVIHSSNKTAFLALCQGSKTIYLIWSQARRDFKSTVR